MNLKLQWDNGLMYRISEPSGIKLLVGAIGELNRILLDIMTNKIM